MEKNHEEVRFWVEKWQTHIREHGYWDANLRHAPILDYPQARIREASEHAKRILAMLNLPLNTFNGKVVVDIGAGPVCALEYSGASLGYVVDPCSDAYKKNDLLITGPTPVHYMNVGAENIPIASKTVDIVIAFNCLDHVDDLEKVMQSVSRILKPGGLFLVNIELDHEPTECEPISISEAFWTDLIRQNRLEKIFQKIYVPEKSNEAEYMHHNSKWLHGAYCSIP